MVAQLEREAKRFAVVSQLEREFTSDNMQWLMKSYNESGKGDEVLLLLLFFLFLFCFCFLLLVVLLFNVSVSCVRVYVCFSDYVRVDSCCVVM